MQKQGKISFALQNELNWHPVLYKQIVELERKAKR